MATRAEVNAVYAAGLIQGITLVTFPAASTIFTSPSEYGLSNTQYGTMFLPQVITAITGSLLGGKLAERFGIKRVFLAGLAAGLASMALLIVSQFFESNQPVAYGLLLAATACLGAGFGLTVPAINSLTAISISNSTDDMIGSPCQNPRPTKMATNTGASAVPRPSRAFSTSTEPSTLSGWNAAVSALMAGTVSPNPAPRHAVAASSNP